MFWQEQWFLLAVALGPFILDIFSGGELFGKDDGTVDEDEATQTEATDSTSTDSSTTDQTSTSTGQTDTTASETDASADQAETSTDETDAASDQNDATETTTEDTDTSTKETTTSVETRSLTTVVDENGDLVAIDLDASAYGKDGSDTVNGGEFDDLLVGGSEDNPEDNAADTLSGGAGNDILYLGDADTATGGADADQFRTTTAITENAVIKDFTVGEDQLVVEHFDTETVGVQVQSITDKGLEITFSNGTHVILEGLDSALEDSSISYISVATS